MVWARSPQANKRPSIWTNQNANEPLMTSRAFAALIATATLIGSGGPQMADGEENPLGARAMYLGNTLYRIRGSNDPDSIGQAESSGCFRTTNDDVKDLYERVAIGTTVIVR